MAAILSSRQYKRALHKHMRSGVRIDEARQKVNDQFAADHPECLASAYKVVLNELQPKVKAVLEFFLGGEDGVDEWEALSKEEQKKPWFYSAWRCHQLEIDFVVDKQHSMEKLATASKWAVKVGVCRCCKQQHTFNIHLGVAMLVCCGRMTREQWKAWANSGGAKGTRSQDVSHLNGISGDMNPLNLTTEASSRNISRNECFGLLSLSADPTQKRCRKHKSRTPCNFEAARMCGNWEAVVEKMVELGRDGVPAVRAYDTVEKWKSKYIRELENQYWQAQCLSRQSIENLRTRARRWWEFSWGPHLPVDHFGNLLVGLRKDITFP